MSINVFDDWPGPGPRREHGNTKKAAFSCRLQQGCDATTTSRRNGRRPLCVFVRGNHLYPHGGPAVSNLLTETSQLSSRDKAVSRPFRESLLSSFSSSFSHPPPFLSTLFISSVSPSFSLSRSLLISSYLSAELHCATRPSYITCRARLSNDPSQKDERRDMLSPSVVPSDFRDASNLLRMFISREGIFADPDEDPKIAISFAIRRLYRF